MGRRKQIQTDYIAELQREYRRWVQLFNGGCTDPFWPDGVNLNLVRSHIFYYKHMIRETMAPDMFPEEYFYEMPPEVDPEYMANGRQLAGRGRAPEAAEKAGEVEKPEGYQYSIFDMGLTGGV